VSNSPELELSVSPKEFEAEPEAGPSPEAEERISLTQSMTRAKNDKALMRIEYPVVVIYDYWLIINNP